MKSLVLAIALAGVAMTGTASASYLISPTATPEERDRYEWYHTLINQYHTGPANTVVAPSSVDRHAGHAHRTAPEIVRPSR